MFLLFISYVMAQRVVDASCLCLPVAAAATGQFWPEKSCGNPSLSCTFSLSFPHGGTGEDSDGSLLSLGAEACWGCFLGVFSGGVEGD